MKPSLVRASAAFSATRDAETVLGEIARQQRRAAARRRPPPGRAPRHSSRSARPLRRLGRVEIGARRLVHDAAHHAPKSLHRRPAPPRDRRASSRSRWRSNSRRSSACPAGVSVSSRWRRSARPVRLRDVARSPPARQHAGEALLGDAQDGQQLGDGDPRVAADEVQRPVVRAAQAQLRPGSASAAPVKSR